MNKLIIIGNLTRDPAMRQTSDGALVCDFTVAVNSRKKDGEAQFFRVTAWRTLAEICSKYLAKGRKVCVMGAVSVQVYQSRTGETKASLEVTASDIEFLTSRAEDAENENGQTDDENASQMASAASRAYSPANYGQTAQRPVSAGYSRVEDEELPF